MRHRMHHALHFLLHLHAQAGQPAGMAPSSHSGRLLRTHPHAHLLRHGIQHPLVLKAQVSQSTQLQDG